MHLQLRRSLIFLGITSSVLVLLLIGCIVFGGPHAPAAMASINAPFKALDYSDLPPVQTFAAADGTPLAYRAYAPAGSARGSVTLVHGSSASSHSMHAMAKALVTAGYQVYALDMRGHGESGTKGHIAYIRQLESDVESFVHAIQPAQPSTLAGFSSGGGFVLRFAGCAQQKLFGSYLLLSPFLSQDVPNQRPNSGGWVDVGIPRIIGLTVLDAVGLRAFHTLPVTAFAFNEEARTFLTPTNDFNLAANFRPHSDYMANIKRVQQPSAILAGADDEAFHTDQLQGIVQSAGQDWPVELLPAIQHIPLTLDAQALAATVRMVGKLQS